MLLAALVTFLTLMLVGVPIGFVMLASALVAAVAEPSIMSAVLMQRLVYGTQSFPLLAIPLFILTGELINISGVATRVMAVAQYLTRRMTGGLAQTNIVIATLLSGVSGSGNADAAMLGKIVAPEMTRRGYSRGFTANLIASSGIITTLIPPGIGLILFGFAANISIGKIFAGGILPGLLLAAALMITTYLVARKRKYESTPADGVAERHMPLKMLLLNTLPALLLPILLIVGLRAGIFTPTEAAGVAVLYSLVCCIVYRETTWMDLWRALRSTAITTSAIMIVFAVSDVFSWVLSFEGVPQRVGEQFLSFTNNPILMLIVISVVLFVAGIFIEGAPLILIFGPMFLPVVKELGIDPVQYAIASVYMVTLGAISPPVGTLMFTTCSVTGTSVAEFIREMGPFIIPLVIVDIAIILFPPLTTFLANW